jgi:hypothetical protein
MTKQSENNKMTKTDTIDKSRQPSAAPTKDELNEQELEKASGGAIDAYLAIRKSGGSGEKLS